MKKSIYSFVVIITCVFVFGISTIVNAQVVAAPQQPPAAPSTAVTVGKIQNPIKVNSLSDFVATVLEVILKIAIPIIAAFIIYSGLMFVLARGNSEKLEQAKTRLLYTLIGAGVILGAWMIATVVKTTIEALTA